MEGYGYGQVAPSPVTLGGLEELSGGSRIPASTWPRGQQQSRGSHP